MIRENRQLVCTFTTQNQLLTTMRSILSSFDIMYNRVYIFENKDDRNDVLYTYNIRGVKIGQPFLGNTISIHRKKQSNTFYTINALNNLIQEMNDLVKNSTGPSESTGETDAQRRARIGKHMSKEQLIGN